MNRWYLLPLVVVSSSILACGGLLGDDAEEPAVAADGDASGSTTSDDAGEATVGAPVQPAPTDLSVAGRSLEVELCTIDGAEFSGDHTMSVFKSVAVDGDRLLIAGGDGRLYGFSIQHDDGCTLKLDPSFGTDGIFDFERDVEWVSASNGTVVAANGIAESYVIRGNTLAYTCAADGYIELAEGGSWGIAPWVNATVERVYFETSGCRSEEWALRHLSDDSKREGNFTSVNGAAVVGDVVYIGGPLATSISAEGTRVIGVFSATGTEIRRFGGSDDINSPEKFGWVHAINACSPGVCVLDSNFRRLTIWSEAGVYQGTVDLKDLLGLDYPWINDFATGADGAVWFVAAQSRDEGEAADGFVYRVTGLAGGSAKRSATGTARMMEVLANHRSNPAHKRPVRPRVPVESREDAAAAAATTDAGPSKAKAASKAKSKSKAKAKGKSKGKGKKH